MDTFWKLLKDHKKIIILSALAVALAAGLLSLTAPFRYSATARILITQRAAFTLDPYTAIRSNQLIAEHLSQVVVTSSFLDKVLDPQFQIKREYFEGGERARRRLWTSTLRAKEEQGKGLIRITAYHPDREEALKIVNAVTFLLSTQGSEYIGRDIAVRLVDAPLTSRFPVRPNIILNFVVGAFLGALAASGWIWFEHAKRTRREWIHREG